MSVKLVTRQVGDVTVVDASGRITLGEGSKAFREQIETLVFGRPRSPNWEDNMSLRSKKVNVLINFGDISYIDSSGIGELVSGFTLVTNAGGKLKLLNLGLRLTELLQNTHLYTDFEVFDDVGAAIRSFDSD